MQFSNSIVACFYERVEVQNKAENSLFFIVTPLTAELLMEDVNTLLSEEVSEICKTQTAATLH